MKVFPHSMAFFSAVLLFCLLLFALGICAGCSHAVPPQENSTTAVQSLSETLNITATPPAIPVARATQRITREDDLPSVCSLEVVRNRSFQLNGSVPDPAMKTVQVWTIADRKIATAVKPVSPDGTYSVFLPASFTASLPGDDTGLIVQYPDPPDRFTVNFDPAGGSVLATNNGSTLHLFATRDLESLDNFSIIRRIESAIFLSGTNNSCSAYSLRVNEGWIEIDPVSPTTPGSLVITGSTSLPAGTPLGILVSTGTYHPTPKNYDYSHEIAEGAAVVVAGSGSINRFSATIDTAKLYAGNCGITVRSDNPDLPADGYTATQIIPRIPVSPVTTNYGDWARLSLPELQINASIMPFVQDSEWKIVAPGTQVKVTDLPYGSILWCGGDAICRAFDAEGIQFLAVYNTNQENQMEVPSGAAIGGMGNVTTITVNDKVVLTKIDEYVRGGVDPSGYKARTT